MSPILLFQRAYGDVRPDKATPGRIDGASGQPRYAIDEPPIRQTIRQDSSPVGQKNLFVHKDPSPIRPTHHGSQTRQLRELAGCVTDDVFTKVESLRDQWGEPNEKGKRQRLSRSQVVASIITRGVQGIIDMKYGSLLQPVFQKELRDSINPQANRIVSIAAPTRAEATLARIYNQIILSLVLKDNVKLFAEYQQAAREQARSILYHKKEKEDKKKEETK